MKTRVLLLSSALLLGACGEEPKAGEPAAAESRSTISDEVVGVALSMPRGWSVMRDPVLFDTHGFMVHAPASELGEARTGHESDAVARIALAYKAQPSQLEALVRTKMEQYREFNPTRTEVPLADGRKGIAISGLPGTQPYSIVYTVEGERVYEIGLWTEAPGLDARAKSVLGSIRFQAPTRTVESLGLKTAQEATFAELTPEQKAESERAAAERKARVLEAMAAGELPQGRQETWEAPVHAMTCGFTAPSSLYWQLQWDWTNTFYSGSWYDYGASYKGWTAMSGNGGSWWGSGYHTGFCDANYSNQNYANDWPAQSGANAYAAFSGYVEWAGWGTDGFATLGNYVVVRNGYYRNVTAHLSSIASGMAWGTWIDGYYKVIGYAGSTGGNWAPHLHARVSYNESLTYNGQPYGGETVRPNRLRCFACTDYDVAATSGGGGYYTNFYQGRWMLY
jgi:murein DD-endopeptidase MepM/ murein hydrolase activator NlpD